MISRRMAKLEAVFVFKTLRRMLQTNHYQHDTNDEEQRGRE